MDGMEQIGGFPTFPAPKNGTKSRREHTNPTRDRTLTLGLRF